MRNFIIKKIINNETETEINSESKYYRESLNLIPKISKTFKIKGKNFRCIEHMPGKLVLKNDKYTLIGMEKRIHHFKINENSKI
jgi:hypothetical protein